MLYTYPDSIGYINNKKSLSSVTVSNGHVTYILGTEDDRTDTGKRLVIKTYGSYGTAAPVEGQTLVPILPYRVMINDKTLLNYSNRQSILKYNASDLNLYNPGIDFNVVDSASGCWPSGFGDTTRFIELNLTRKCFPVMGLPAGSSYEIQHTVDKLGKLRIRPTKLEAYDVQASMSVESAGADDYLYISVVSRVDLIGSYSMNNISWKNNFNWSWSIPIVVKLVVSRASIDRTLRGRLQEITPTAWSYPIDSNWFDTSPKVSIGKINTSIPSTPQTKLWNYNIIPGRVAMNFGTALTNFPSFIPTNNGYLIPLSFGCCSDIYSLDSSNILCLTSIGNYYPSEGNYKQVHTISKIARASTGFVLPSNRNSQEQTLDVASRNIIYKTGSGTGDYYIALIQTYNQSKSGINMLVFNYDFYLVAQVKMFHVNDADLIEKSGSVYLLLIGDTEKKIYKFPTADATFINRLGKTSNTALGNGGEKVLTDAGMTLVHSSTISPNVRSFIDFKPTGSTNNYKIDINTLDKSIDLRGMSSGTTNHLRLIGTSCIAVDKVTLSTNGQSNKIEYWIL